MFYESKTKTESKQFTDEFIYSSEDNLQGQAGWWTIQLQRHQASSRVRGPKPWCPSLPHPLRSLHVAAEVELMGQELNFGAEISVPGKSAEA